MELETWHVLAAVAIVSTLVICFIGGMIWTFKLMADQRAEISYLQDARQADRGLRPLSPTAARADDEEQEAFEELAEGAFTRFPELNPGMRGDIDIPETPPS